MYSDLFDHLGSNSAGAGGSGSNSSNSNEKKLVTFKAGKMDLTLQENGKYWAEPDTRRGEIRLVWKTSESTLYWEWYDRREKSVSDDDRHLLWSVGGNATDLGTLERVADIPNAAPQDRLYVWSRPPQAGSTTPDYRMYWMQDASDEKDDELIAQVNQYLSDPASANPSSSSSAAGGGGSNNNRSGGSANAGSSSNEGGGSSSSSSDRQQVDALSNILENLGMPQNESGAAGSTSSGGAASGSGGSSSSTTNNNAATGTLTLADLQGAMAGIQQQATAGRPGPPLQELVTPAAISSLLENDAVKKRLLELLPEEQRSEEFLEANLRSPQVQQTLRSLTACLLPDDTGSMDGYHSVLANFQMAEGAQEALQSNSNNPIQAFLECVLKSVEKEKKEEEGGGDEEGKKEEESKE